MPAELTEQQKGFIEEVGFVFEQTGFPRMAGRVFGWLSMADPPYQSPGELAAVLQASKGSISTTLRLLSQVGLIERYIIPGARHDYFRLHPDALQKIVRHGLEEEIIMFKILSEHGLELLKDESSERRRWLAEMHDRYSFLDREFPSLMERYEQRRARNQAASMKG